MWHIIDVRYGIHGDTRHMKWMADQTYSTKAMQAVTLSGVYVHQAPHLSIYYHIMWM